MGAAPTKGVWQACPSARGGRYQQATQIPSSAHTCGAERLPFSHWYLSLRWQVLDGLYLTSHMGPGTAQPRALVKWDLDHDEKPAFLFFFLFAPLVPLRDCWKCWHPGVVVQVFISFCDLLWEVKIHIHLSLFIPVSERIRHFCNKWTGGRVDKLLIGSKGLVVGVRVAYVVCVTDGWWSSVGTRDRRGLAGLDFHRGSHVTWPAWCTGRRQGGNQTAPTSEAASASERQCMMSSAVLLLFIITHHTHRDVHVTPEWWGRAFIRNIRMRERERERARGDDRWEFSDGCRLLKIWAVGVSRPVFVTNERDPLDKWRLHDRKNSPGFIYCQSPGCDDTCSLSIFFLKAPCMRRVLLKYLWFNWILKHCQTKMISFEYADSNRLQH